jgi:hypothetical protein
VRLKLRDLLNVMRLDENEPGPKTSGTSARTGDGNLMLRRVMSRYASTLISNQVNQAFSGPMLDGGERRLHPSIALHGRCRDLRVLPSRDGQAAQRRPSRGKSQPPVAALVAAFLSSCASSYWVVGSRIMDAGHATRGNQGPSGEPGASFPGRRS